MTRLEFDDVLLTPPLLLRLQQETLSAVERLREAGVSPSQPDTEFFALPDGRLRIVSTIAPGFSVMTHADPHEWHRKSSN